MSSVKINYPKGQRFQHMGNHSAGQKRKQPLSYSNRGMSLEADLNLTNKQYLAGNQAIIHKKPTPIQVVKVDYPARAAAKITEAYYTQSSTTDYNGVYRGYYLDFEAKQTKNKTSFPLSNFHEHQIDHMKASCVHGGICFVIILFSTLDEHYFVPSDFLFKWWDQQFQPDGRKSIPLAALKKDCAQIPYGFNPRIPYLPFVDQLIDKKKENR